MNTYPDRKHSVLICTLLTFFCFFSTPLLAQNLYLQDHAKVVNQEMADKLETAMSEIEKSTGLHMEMVILPSFNNQEPKNVIDNYMQQLNKNAARSTKKALILITLNPQGVSIQSTQNIAEAFEGKAFLDIEEQVKDKIAEKNYNEMARIGVAGMFHYYQKEFSGQERFGLNKNYFNALLIVLLAIGMIIAFRMKKKKN